MTVYIQHTCVRACACHISSCQPTLHELCSCKSSFNKPITSTTGSSFSQVTMLCIMNTHVHNVGKVIQKNQLDATIIY